MEPAEFQLLAALCSGGYELNANHDYESLRLYPSEASEQLVTLVRDYLPLLRELLPGYCYACGGWSFKRTRTYWHDRYLCPRCLDVALDLFEERGWRPAYIPENLETLTD